MKFNFTGEIGDLSVGLSEIAATLHFEIGADGAEIAVKKSKDGRLRVSNTAIEYAQTTHFFRAIGLLCEHWNEGEFKITEVPQFDTNGVMIDVSQSNAAVNIESTKDMLRRMAIMGLNTYYLYMEDTYEVPEEPYFGYLRPCYSQAELREIDDYAYGLGITVIPCIQTLAHLIDALKWPPYEGFQDDHDTLLVGDPRTYELLDHMLRSIRASVRSKKIHIGLD
ncbi:MAG: family 20 glycosylhydrolase, partial [Clostridia bacterium]